MAKYEEETKSEAEMKKTHQATLIPEEKDEEPENGEGSAAFEHEELGKKLIKRFRPCFRRAGGRSRSQKGVDGYRPYRK
jgi:hypothetical protein